MNELHKTIGEDEYVNSKEEQRKGLCSNNVSPRCSSLDNNPDFSTNSEKVDYLAQLIVEIYLSINKNELQQIIQQYKEGSHILQSLDERTSRGRK